MAVHFTDRTGTSGKRDGGKETRRHGPAVKTGRFCNHRGTDQTRQSRENYPGGKKERKAHPGNSHPKRLVRSQFSRLEHALGFSRRRYTFGNFPELFPQDFNDIRSSGF